MWNAIVSEDDTSQILSAWIAKEELRTLLSTVRIGGDPHLTRHRLHRFLAWCIDSQIPELLTLAATIDQWWPEINAFVQTGITNARTEGYNRLVKQVKRGGFNRPSGLSQPEARWGGDSASASRCRWRLAMTRAWRATSLSHPRSRASSRRAISSVSWACRWGTNSVVVV
jgi:hypothetical protein